MGVLLHEVFPKWFGLFIFGWPLYAYGLSIFALIKALRNYDFTIVLIISLLVLLPSIFLTWVLLTEGREGFLIWLIFVAAPFFMSAAALYRNLHVRVTRI
jgi:hypothetical protein